MRWSAMGIAMLTAAASPAVADQGEASSSQQALGARCVALLQGSETEASQGLRERCAELVRDAAGTEPTSSSVAAGIGSAFQQAGTELVGRGGDRLQTGMTRHGPARNLLTTNPLGWFSGLGVNLTYSRALESLPKASWVASARYARANATNGNATTVGIGAGADWFLIGRDNEGLRIGPRLEGSFGSESFGSRTSYARLGLSGELGYNFVASNGIAALAAVGFGGRLAGDEQNETFTSFTGGELGPYLKLGIGYGF